MIVTPAHPARPRHRLRLVPVALIAFAVLLVALPTFALGATDRSTGTRARWRRHHTRARSYPVGTPLTDSWGDCLSGRAMTSRLCRVAASSLVVCAMVALAMASSPSLAVASSPSVAAKGDTGWIAWADKVGIHLIRPNGTGSHLLVARWGARYPSWSPNGQWLAYAQLGHWSTLSSSATIVLIRPNGTGRRLVAHGFEPTWTRDGKSIIFINDARKPPYLRILNVATGKVSVLRVPRLDSDPNAVVPGDGHDAYSISRDGTKIAWESGTNPSGSTAPMPSNYTWIYTVNLDGTNFRAPFTPNRYWDEGPHWTADNRVTYPCVRGRVSSDLCLVDPTSGKVSDFNASDPNRFMEEWANPSPSGARVVVGAVDALYTASRSNKNVRVLEKVTTPSGNPTDPVWQP